MILKYRIVSVSKQDHLMVVRYFNDLFTEDYLANFFNPDGSIARTPEGYPVRCRSDFSISFFDNKIPTEQDVIDAVNRSAPRFWFSQLEAALNNELDLSAAVNKVGIVGEVSESPPPPPPMPF